MHRLTASLTRIPNSRLSTRRFYNRSTIHDPTENPITNEGATKILREMVRHLWPRDVPSHKYRVVGLDFVSIVYELFNRILNWYTVSQPKNT